MIRLQKLRDCLDKIYSIEQFTDYCPNGLQVEGKDEIEKVATAVTASLETIETAIEWSADALIVHHGFFWKGDCPRVIGAMRKKLAQLLEHNISLFAYHLPMDAHQMIGNNWRAAKEMGWNQLEPFYSPNGIPLGVKGKVELSRDQLKKQLEDYYKHPAQIAFGGKKEVKSVGLISGGAYRQIKDAALEGLDAFVTGNTDEPAWHLSQEEGVNFYALGHSATEKVGPFAIAEHLADRFTVEAQFLDLENPF